MSEEKSKRPATGVSGKNLEKTRPQQSSSQTVAARDSAEIPPMPSVAKKPTTSKPTGSSPPKQGSSSSNKK